MNKVADDRYRQLSAQQIERLVTNGMVWNVTEYSWTKAYETAVQFYKQSVHIRVPRDTVVNGVDLQAWICRQRKNYTKGKLPQERILKLAVIEVIVLPDTGIGNGMRKAAVGV